jgi:hypothetical protein
VHYFCVTHQPIPWRMPSFMTQVGTGDYMPPSGIALSERFPEWANSSATFSEYAALFALRRVLEEEPGGRFVGFCHGRRFPVAEPVAPRRGFNQVISPAEFEALPDTVFVRDGRTVLAPPVVNFGMTVLEQYAHDHLARDILRFFATAVDLGAITDTDAAAFLSRPGFIPASSVAVVPTDWAVRTLTTLEEVAVAFHEQDHTARDGYQQRVIGFCLERLNGMFVERLLRDTDPDRRQLHLSLLVSEDGRVVRTE